MADKAKQQKTEKASSSRVQKQAADPGPQIEMQPMLAPVPDIVHRVALDPLGITPPEANALQRTLGMRSTRGLVTHALQRAPRRSQPAAASPVAASDSLQRLLTKRSLIVQPKLTVGAANDSYEQEADRVANQVMSMSTSAPASAPVVARKDDETAQRATANPGEEEDEKKPSPPAAGISAKDPDDDDDDDVQASPLPGFKGGDVDPSVAHSIESARGSGQSLHDGVRATMERGFGADFSSVRVHTGGQADALNRSLNARAFTTGRDVFFSRGEYNPASTAGQKLIAHELTHTVQQGAAGVRRVPRAAKPGAVQREFNPATTTGKAHLRGEGAWKVHKGPDIPKGTTLLADQDAGKNKVQHRTIGFNTNWKPAVNENPNHQGDVPGTREGYIRQSKVRFTGAKLSDILKSRITRILRAAELKYPALANKLVKDEHVKFLLDKGLRYDSWNSGASLDTFVSGFKSKEDKFTRLEEGAEYVADSLMHWKKWLRPPTGRLVRIVNVKLVQSDLHEKGLGVVMVEFKKPKGPRGHKFANDTTVKAMIKPEDKSLEENLLGDKADSAVNKINRIVGLVNPDEMLTTIKMQSDALFGSLVELVKGSSAEDITNKGLPKPMTQSFHETMVFAFLAGLDDLHRENVFYDVGGRPYLIDADNVLSYNQMINKDNGSYTQSGFGSNYNAEEAKKNKKAVTDKNNTINSKILDAMLKDNTKKMLIIDAIKEAIAGKEGRVVPIRTSAWGQRLSGYAGAQDKNTVLTSYASAGSLVREGKPFEGSIGPGLAGVTSKNVNNPFYDPDAEKGQLKKDFDAGVVPFYVYHFNTGYVTHNGVKIYHGQTLEQAMNLMLEKFDPSKTARTQRMFETLMTKLEGMRGKFGGGDDHGDSDVEDSEWD